MLCDEFNNVLTISPRIISFANVSTNDKDRQHDKDGEEQASETLLGWNSKRSLNYFDLRLPLVTVHSFNDGPNKVLRAAGKNFDMAYQYVFSSLDAFVPLRKWNFDVRHEFKMF